MQDEAGVRGEPPARDYEHLQGFLGRDVSLEASRRGLAGHLHTGTHHGAGFGRPWSSSTTREGG